MEVEAPGKILETFAIADLPSPAPAALHVVGAITQARPAEAPVSQLAAIVAEDPKLSEHLVYAATLAAPTVAGGAGLDGIQDACEILGATGVHAASIAYSVMDSNRTTGCLSFNDIEFWSEALARGVSMARVLRNIDAELTPVQGFAYGLLSRIGRLGLAKAFSDQYGELLESSKEWINTAETETFGIGGDRLSALLLQGWELDAYSKLLTWQTTASSETQDPSCRKFQLLLQFGECAGRMFVKAKAEINLLKGIAEAASELGLTSKQMFDSFDGAIEDWQQVGKRLRIGTRNVPQLAQFYSAFS